MQQSHNFFLGGKIIFYGKSCYSDEYKRPWLHLIYLLGEEDAMEFRFSGSPDPGTHVFHAVLEARLLFTWKSERGWWEGKDICLSLTLIRSCDGARVLHGQSFYIGFTEEYINLCWEEIPDIKWLFNLLDKFRLEMHYTLFTLGMINHWNKLPVELMNSRFLDACKSRLDAFLEFMC